MDTKDKIRLLSLIKKCSFALSVVNLAVAYLVPNYLAFGMMIAAISGVTGVFSTALHCGYKRELPDRKPGRE
ncbi:MAG: hypothetical protein ACYCUV_00245 [Phycisphaerae bacterium]